MTAPTARQLEVMGFMRTFLIENDEMPPMWAVAKHFSFRSENAAQCHVDALKRRGYLEANATGEVKFLRGRVPATARKRGCDE
ncbi:SOS-response transcriptional repressor LexA [Comamonas sp. BIGb0152]|uniref:LexA family protein n=1 Tax=Comamonas sp. BIGb0152 TaxID=2940601 RepID=UPI00216851E1|nr:hypothetical protein [Comamonas sp. BIGb0152]MCS4292709.1 SOS-response transcriptional repressor LexA [Comamonas sp. BIGb0152]